ncbi:hypothetical protein B0H19DRAFT_1183690, partial [Mycena capillaripes]
MHLSISGQYPLHSSKRRRKLAPWREFHCGGCLGSRWRGERSHRPGAEARRERPVPGQG